MKKIESMRFMRGKGLKNEADSSFGSNVTSSADLGPNFILFNKNDY
jgi:hypothetical protein